MNKNNLKFLILAYTLFNLGFVYSQENNGCPVEEATAFQKLNKEIQAMAKSAPTIDWWSANPEMILSKKCKEKNPTSKEIENEIDRLGESTQKISPTIHSVAFNDESPELIEAFKRLTTNTDYMGKEKSVTNLQSKYKINPGCNKVKCALEKIFGKDLGNKLLYINLKSGFNGSQLAFDDSSQLNNKEADSLISAINAYPASRFPIDKNKQLTKFKRGFRLSSHEEGVIAYAAIAFYDEWSSQSEPMREYTAFHEMGHYVAMELNLDKNKDWLSFSGWVDKDGDWTATNKNSVASKYGATNPAEDFAESVTAYRYNPQLLKEVSPEKYQFIKETVFDGLEYTNENLCKISNSNSHKLIGLLPQNPPSRTPEELTTIYAGCGTETRNYLLGQYSREQLDHCLSSAQNAIDMSRFVDKIEPKLKYAQLVKDGFAIQKPDIQADKKTSPDYLKDAKVFLRNQYINDIYEWDKSHYFNYKGSDAKPICEETWGKYGYMAVFTKNEEVSIKVSAYRTKEEFNKIFVGLCEKIHEGKKGFLGVLSPNLKPFTKEEIDNALGPNFP